MIYEQRLAAVDPISLATVSGATKIRRFAAPMPAVVRPLLLTDRLRGPSCCSNCDSLAFIPPDYGSLRRYNLGQTADDSTLDINNLGVPSAGSGNISLLQTIASSGASGETQTTQNIVGTAAAAANFIPGIGPVVSVAISTFNNFLNELTGWLGIGAGRQEANVIVPIQNQMMAQLGNVTNEILTGQTPTVAQLQTLYRTVWQLGVGFQEFVLLNTFTDRRASGQALNTVMPYIDGTCGYAVPVGPTATPGQFNCLTWGSGTIGGAGTNGMLGAIARALTMMGGAIPALPDVHQTANNGIQPATVTGAPATAGSSSLLGGLSPLTIGVGLVALFFLVRK